MLSILPKHVADEMLKDMKKDESQKDQQQFNTMYMYRHENVRCAGCRPGLRAQDGGFGGVGGALRGSRVFPALETRPPHSVSLSRRRGHLAARCWGRDGSRGPGPSLYRRHPRDKLNAGALSGPGTCQGLTTSGLEQGPGRLRAGAGAGGGQRGARHAVRVLTTGACLPSSASSLPTSWASPSCLQPAAPKSS